MSKPTVQYRELFGPVVVGQPAYVMPVDHPSHLVSNVSYAVTSKVVKVSEDGKTFETQNTLYIPVQEERSNA